MKNTLNSNQNVCQEPDKGIRLRYGCLLPVRVQSVLMVVVRIEQLSFYFDNLPASFFVPTLSMKSFSSRVEDAHETVLLDMPTFTTKVSHKICLGCWPASAVFFFRRPSIPYSKVFGHPFCQNLYDSRTSGWTVWIHWHKYHEHRNFLTLLNQLESLAIIFPKEITKRKAIYYELKTGLNFFERIIVQQKIKDIDFLVAVF